jgi:hypothetical protein
LGGAYLAEEASEGLRAEEEAFHGDVEQALIARLTHGVSARIEAYRARSVTPFNYYYDYLFIYLLLLLLFLIDFVLTNSSLVGGRGRVLRRGRSWRTQHHVVVV